MALDGFRYVFRGFDEKTLFLILSVRRRFTEEIIIVPTTLIVPRAYTLKFSHTAMVTTPLYNNFVILEAFFEYYDEAARWEYVDGFSTGCGGDGVAVRGGG